MISWILLAVIASLLAFAPMVLFNLVYNTFRVMLLLLGEFLKSGHRLYEIIAASPTIHKIPIYVFRFCHTLFRALWFVLDLPSYIEIWMSNDDSHHTCTPSVAFRGRDSIDYTITPNAISSNDGPIWTPRVISSSMRSCVGITVNGSPCKRAKMMSSDDPGRYYCRDHEKQRQQSNR